MSDRIGMTARIELMAPPAFVREWKRAAKANGKTLSEWLRDAARVALASEQR